MATYKVQVSTGQEPIAGTFDSIFITLVGSRGESPKHALDAFWVDFQPGAVGEYEVPSAQSLGQIVLVRLHKEPYSFFPENIWFCNFVRVTSPEGQTYHFPCYQWIYGYCTVELAESTAKTPCDDAHPLVQKQRREELVLRQERYSQAQNSGVLASCTAPPLTTSPCSLPKTRGHNLKGWHVSAASPEYVTEHWKEDEFFGYQYLNGVNPVVIRKCTELPDNFPVTHEMVAGFLGESASLHEELKVMLPVLTPINKPISPTSSLTQYIAAPLCLLHQKPSGALVPLAIQLSQHPGPNSPIFLPSDSDWLWTLAKTWVRSSEFHLHEVTSHLLRAHLLAEVFAVATLRQLPMCHPLYKLLVPHIRFSIHIDVLARTFLVSPGGVFDRAIATGRQGLADLLRKSFENLTYTTLCLPDDIQERGVASLKNYYYRDDGLKIWAAIESFVSGIVAIYYRTNLAVQGDHELQAWVGEIFAKGFLGRQASGVPSALSSVAELTKYLTMMIFTCSAYHAAVNAGQFELAVFMPNSPSSMRKPPPQNKAPVTLEDPGADPVLKGLSGLYASVFNTLPVPFQRSLGTYPEEHFTEEGPKQLMAAFQDRLAEISREIEERNQSLTLSYTYLYPPNIENSTAI
uniref:Arachidonate lipoxygenase 3 n=1 Tax=Pelusios castaneus TaxID=367368 RepID=A0A8C8SVW8_9SAUR